MKSPGATRTTGPKSATNCFASRICLHLLAFRKNCQIASNLHRHIQVATSIAERDSAGDEAAPLLMRAVRLLICSRAECASLH